MSSPTDNFANMFRSSRSSSIRDWLSPRASDQFRKEVQNFPSWLKEQPKKSSDFVEVQGLEYLRKVRCYLFNTVFLVAREKVWKPKTDIAQFELDEVLRLTECTFYFSGDILVLEKKGAAVRYFEFCEESDVWKLLLRQAGCLGPSEDSCNILVTDEGQFDLPTVLSPPAFFIPPRSEHDHDKHGDRHCSTSQCEHETLRHCCSGSPVRHSSGLHSPSDSSPGRSSGETTPRSEGNVDFSQDSALGSSDCERSPTHALASSKHLCCSANCLLDIPKAHLPSPPQRRMSSSCSSLSTSRDFNRDDYSTRGEGYTPGKKKKKIGVSLTLSRKLRNTNIHQSIENFQDSLQLNIFNIKPEHFAEELLYLDQKHLLAMSPQELKNSEWIGSKKAERSPNIVATINFFNRVSLLVTQLILDEVTPHSRARLIRHFITIGERCRVYNNYGSLRAIVAGLQSNPIYRLSKTWKMVKGASLRTFNSLVDIWKHQNNYENYRTLLVKGLQRGFFIPFLGLFFNQVVMTNLIFKELKINTSVLYPDELEGPWDATLCTPVDPSIVYSNNLPEDTDDIDLSPQTHTPLSDSLIYSNMAQDDPLPAEISVNSACFSPCFPTTQSSFSRKLKRLKKKPLHAGEVGSLPKVEQMLGPVAEKLSAKYGTKILQLHYLPPYLLRRYQLAASLQTLTHRPAVSYFIFRDELKGDSELYKISFQREPNE